jgi:integral membrane protein
MRKSVSNLRWAGLIEAVSYILLVAIAMPLKYIWGRPEAVSVVGMIHGVLFVIFCAALLQVVYRVRWPLGRAALVFVMALLPFGPFLIDGRMKRWELEAGEPAPQV